MNRSYSTTIESNSLEDEDSRRSSKRISEFLQAKKKHKIISKDRTIYHQRKTTYVPKKISKFDFDLPEPQAFKTQSSFYSEGTELKSYNLEKVEMEDSFEESILVCETPKKAMKVPLSIISQKLEFIDL